MELSPEERKKIYEEEKARLEAGEKARRESSQLAYDTSTGLAPNVAALLCYLGWWVTGLIFFILEQKNAWVRFHAAQSLLFFGAVTLASIIVNVIPFVGGVLSAIIWIIGFIYWIVLMVKAYQGEHYMIPVAGEIADRMVAAPGRGPDYHYTPSPPPPQPSPPSETAAPAAAVIEAPPTETAPAGVGAERQARRYRRERREARIVGGAIAIVFLLALLIFFNFFYEYAAYYSADTVNGAVVWTRQPFFTSEISEWLPVLNAALIIGIIGHMFLMFVDNGFVRRSIRIVMDALGLATVVTLLTVYPFDFNAIPDSTAASITQVVVTVVLILIAIGFGIGLIVRVIGLMVHAARTLSSSEED